MKMHKNLMPILLLTALSILVLPSMQCCRQTHKQGATVTAVTDSTVCMPASKVKALVGAADYWKQKLDACQGEKK